MKSCRFILYIIIVAAWILSPYLPECVYADEENSENQLIYANLLMEAVSGQVIQHENGYEKVPVGTLNKMMTVLLAAEAVENGNIAEDDMVSASQYAGTMQGATVWLLAGEKMSVSDLMKCVIIGNANDASAVLAEAVCGSEEEFVKHMNTRAFELGMRDTVYKNCTGYDTDGQYSTAYDTALLAREMIQHDILVKYMTVWLDYVRGRDTELVNENRLVRTMDGILGVKAGHSDMAGNCCVIAAERDGERYISVILGCDDEDERFSLAKGLINVGFSEYQTALPVLNSEYLIPIKVKGGADSAVGLDTGRIFPIAVRKGREADISCVIVLPEYVNAPVRKNQKIGSASFYIDDTLLCSTDIYADSDVDALTVWMMFKNIYQKLLK
ncbi:MAG: D-alanyl-D-alanine carboxypeptidase family protein [Oscillospiraceae bacterium]